MAELFYLLLGAVFAGYFALAGYDYGVGVLLRSTAKTDEERRLVLGALGPFFLGNEVWLVAGLGLLLAAFPLAEGALLSGLYPVLVPLMAAIVLFTAAVQIRSRAAFARPAWDLAIVVSGFIIAFGWGAVFGLVLQGLPVRLGPLPLITGALTTALFTLHGATLLRLRTPAPIAERAATIANRMTYSAAVLAVAAGLTSMADAQAVRRPVLAAIATAGLAGTVYLAGRLHHRGRTGWALVATGTAAEKHAERGAERGEDPQAANEPDNEVAPEAEDAPQSDEPEAEEKDSKDEKESEKKEKTINTKPKSVKGLDKAQMANALAVIQVGEEMNVPKRGQAIALMTVMQETKFYNLASDKYPSSLKIDNEGVGSDHDSVGIFQQRPSMGWGSVKECMDVEYASTAFYSKLLKVKNWDDMKLTDAAQKVQGSAFPNAYAKWDKLAYALLDEIHQ